MKKMLLLVFIAVCISGFALDVDVEELSSTKDTSVEFVNYEGPHSKIETIEQIKGIGRFLGRQITDSPGRFSYVGKYEIIHAVDPDDLKGMDADIFLILPTAQVDHIENVRRIVSGFLETAYKYTVADADLLARFVSIYNAVFRGRMDYFEQKYKSVVTKNLDSSSAGIATVYTQWPGKTKMLIPLTGPAPEGGIGSLDSDILTEKEVIDQLRTEEDKGLDIRKDITELKEREVEAEQEEIDAERAELEEEQKRIEAEQERLREERERLAEEKAATEDEDAVREIEEREVALREEEDRLQREEEEATDISRDLDEREEQQAERVDRIQQEREEIAEDERELIGQETPTPERTTGTTAAAVTEQILLYLKMSDATGEPLGRIVRIDAASGKILQRSSINTVRKQRFDFLGEDILAVAGSTEGQGAVRLVLINSETLETIGQSEADIFPESSVVVNDDVVYAVAAADDRWVLGRFDDELTLEATSTFAVMPFTTIINMNDKVYVLAEDGTIHALSGQSLADLQTIE